jgi:D-aminoacyl-tRNA deacylase
MKIVLQRVSSAHVLVEDAVVGKIGKGLVVFLGITHTDTEKECRELSAKIANLRIFSDEKGKMNLSVKECEGDVLVVSQFTLYAEVHSGRRPDFLQAAPANIAEGLYTQFVQYLSDLLGKPVQTGIFGAKMQVHLVNDGPVTIII